MSPKPRFLTSEELSTVVKIMADTRSVEGYSPIADDPAYSEVLGPLFSAWVRYFSRIETESF